jgi:N-acetylmuramoyl-L-alanine amidase
MKSVNSFYSVLLIITSFLFFPFFSSDSFSQVKKFVLVIDAGHGGQDAGAVGSIAKEKDINLAVALKVGKLIEENLNDVKVVYTRKTDVFIPLQRRADIVNENHADLFISIHTNATKGSQAYGAETYTLGLAKTKANLEVAMTENSVILLEDDYKTKYKGFDPSSVDSYIMFEFMQDKYIDKSIEIASSIQNQFVNYAKRHDRGVRQAGFWVLHRSACPSVLVELGFISNPVEERFLVSEFGRNQLSTSIYNAFVNYKRSYDKKMGIVVDNKNYKLIVQSEPVKQIQIVDSAENKSETTVNIINPEISAQNKTTSNKKENSVSTQKVSNFDTTMVFKVQILAVASQLKNGASELKGIKDVNFFIENGMYKYTVGEETKYKKIQEVRRKLLDKFPNAFIIAFKGERKLTLKEMQSAIK